MTPDLPRHLHPLALALLLALPVRAAAYTDLFVFGDSIVDTGNTQALIVGAGFPDPAPAASGYFLGRFTNGVNAADVVNQEVEGELLEGSATPAQGDNFAFGGARAGPNLDLIPDLAGQINAYLTTRAVDPDALYLINAGGNDVRDIVLGELSGVARDLVLTLAAAAIEDAVDDLRDQGAQHIVVVGVGDVGTIPEVLARGAGAAADATQTSVELNAMILAALPIDVGYVDTIGLFAEVGDDPGSFGLPPNQNTSDACLNSALADPAGPPTCAGFAFFDAVHPTTDLHQILGDRIVTVVPEPGAAAALVAVLTSLRALRREPLVSGRSRRATQG